MELSGKTILVTGGTDGIGACLIRQLRDKGAAVITSGRDPGRVEETRAAGFEVIEADLSLREGVDAVLGAVGGRPLDILINNAGAGVDHDFRDGAPDLEAADRTAFLNFNAPVRLISQLMPVLKSRPQAMIVNVTSGLAIAPRAGGPVYCASKAALRSYGMAIRHQLKGTPVRLMEALPPVVETKMTAGRANRKMAPEECARQIISGIERDARQVNVGMVKVLSAVYSLSPALARRIMLRF